MTGLSPWVITTDAQDSARLKYELRNLERALYQISIEQSLDSAAKAATLCGSLATKYQNYIRLITIGMDLPIDQQPVITKKIEHWVEYYHWIKHLQQQVATCPVLPEQVQLLQHIVLLYQQMHELCLARNNEANVLVTSFVSLYNKEEVDDWLIKVVTFCNLYGAQLDLSRLLSKDWIGISTLAFDFFTDVELIDLINALFFYKLYPDKLFKSLVHPEKLVSVRLRLTVLHTFIEKLQSQLHQLATEQHLMPAIDYLFHGNELPQGIMIDVKEQYQLAIQEAVKKIKVKHSAENKDLITQERMQDLFFAYKFWFNPNRLIDAVMVLQQHLVSEQSEETQQLFQQEMVTLFSRFTSTECLDLYGYFANNDTRYLRHTLFSIGQDYPLDWLPMVTEIEKKAVKNVFDALTSVMEALRIELKNRHILTSPYVYELDKNKNKIGRRNREAVLRIILVYGNQNIVQEERIDALFDELG